MNRFKGLLFLLIYIILSLLINLLVAATSNTNLFLYEVLTFAEYWLFAGFIFSQLKNQRAKKLLVVFSVVFSIFFALFSFYIKREVFIDSIPIGIETIIILTFSFYYLYEQTNDTSTLFIYQRPAFWVIVGMVLYLAGCFFIYLFANYLNQDEVERYWFITNLFSTLKNIFFCIAIYINAKPPKESLQYNQDLSRLN